MYWTELTCKPCAIYSHRDLYINGKHLCTTICTCNLILFYVYYSCVHNNCKRKPCFQPGTSGKGYQDSRQKAGKHETINWNSVPCFITFIYLGRLSCHSELCWEFFTNLKSYKTSGYSHWSTSVLGCVGSCLW